MFDEVARWASDDLGYVVAIEHSRVKRSRCDVAGDLVEVGFPSVAASAPDLDVRELLGDDIARKPARAAARAAPTAAARTTMQSSDAVRVRGALPQLICKVLRAAHLGRPARDACKLPTCGSTWIMTTSTVNCGLDQLGTLFHAVTPGDAARPTPCAQWTVADLSDHIVNSVVGMAIMARGGRPDWADSTHHDDPASALDQQGRALVEALDAPGNEFPEGMAAAELAVHTYDLATALGGATADLDPEVAEVGHAFMTSSMTDDMRGDAFGPEQRAPADADAYQRLAAFAGRSV